LKAQNEETKDQIKQIQDSCNKYTESKKELTDKKTSLEKSNNDIKTFVTSKNEEYNRNSN